MQTNPSSPCWILRRSCRGFAAAKRIRLLDHRRSPWAHTADANRLEKMQPNPSSPCWILRRSCRGFAAAKRIRLSDYLHSLWARTADANRLEKMQPNPPSPSGFCEEPPWPGRSRANPSVRLPPQSVGAHCVCNPILKNKTESLLPFPSKPKIQK